MDMNDSYRTEVARAIEERLARLRRLTFEQAAALPEKAGEDAVLGGTRCAVTVYRPSGPHSLPNAVLVTVQVARFRLLSMVSYHTERGLVFRVVRQAE